MVIKTYSHTGWGGWGGGEVGGGWGGRGGGGTPTQVMAMIEEYFWVLNFDSGIFFG